MRAFIVAAFYEGNRGVNEEHAYCGTLNSDCYESVSEKLVNSSIYASNSFCDSRKF